eukprot:scaffold97435_cov93-Attheya_sp.AAC.5
MMAGEHQAALQLRQLMGYSCHGGSKMFSVYGDYVHQNDGTHLDGGFTDDAQWQEYWRKLVVLPPQRFDVPLSESENDNGTQRDFLSFKWSSYCSDARVYTTRETLDKE